MSFESTTTSLCSGVAPAQGRQLSRDALSNQRWPISKTAVAEGAGTLPFWPDRPRERRGTKGTVWVCAGLGWRYELAHKGPLVSDYDARMGT